MNYKEGLNESYVMDGNFNIHRVNILNEDDENYFVIPINQVTQKNKDAVFLTREDALYNSIIKRLENGFSEGYSGHNDYTSIYAEVLQKVKGDRPELFI